MGINLFYIEVKKRERYKYSGKNPERKIRVFTYRFCISVIGTELRAISISYYPRKSTFLKWEK